MLWSPWPNGAGKTTTIEILEGLSQQTSGDVRVVNMDWATNASAIRERIGVSLQETEMSDKLSVVETVDMFRSFYSTGLTTDRAIELVGLQEKKRAWVKHLSGGQSSGWRTDRSIGIDWATISMKSLRYLRFEGRDDGAMCLVSRSTELRRSISNVLAFL